MTTEIDRRMEVSEHVSNTSTDVSKAESIASRAETAASNDNMMGDTGDVKTQGEILTSLEENCSDSKPLSKNQIKRLAKREKWMKLKMEKRANQKKKRKLKFAAAREKGESLGPTRKSLKKNGMKDSDCKVSVVIDCSFDDMMTNKDIIHVTQQIQHSYAANRRAPNGLQFYVTGINGKLKTRLEGIGEYKYWDIYMKEESYMSLFEKEKIVYLSSESPNILSTVEEDKVYIIGGLVDHNHHKGLCHRLAEENGLQHAQLPIGEYIDMKARKVLTINHVFEILLRYTECKSWQEAFFSVLPPRKGALAKSTVTLEEKNEILEPLNEGTEKDTNSKSETCEQTETQTVCDSEPGKTTSDVENVL